MFSQQVLFAIASLVEVFGLWRFFEDSITVLDFTDATVYFPLCLQISFSRQWCVSVLIYLGRGKEKSYSYIKGMMRNCVSSPPTSKFILVFTVFPKVT